MVARLAIIAAKVIKMRKCSSKNNNAMLISIFLRLKEDFMPKNKFQDVIFTVMMVIVMVYAMVVYNITRDMGGLTNQVFLISFAELPIMGVVGFVLEFFFAGNMAKKIAFGIVTPGKSSQFAIMMAISISTVCVMCPLMSFVATILFNGGFDSQIIARWVQLTVTNFPMALGWQIFAAGPFVRFLFSKIFRNEEENAVEEAA